MKFTCSAAVDDRNIALIGGTIQPGGTTGDVHLVTLDQTDGYSWNSSLGFSTALSVNSPAARCVFDNKNQSGRRDVAFLQCSINMDIFPSFASVTNPHG